MALWIQKAVVYSAEALVRQIGHVNSGGLLGLANHPAAKRGVLY
ncbi:hypothetical protein M8C21_029291 [Ambrosia artemisiifolia]|uniref:Uncharacterized protein n=1 Tax=Ambrosia artemisiifolia TaxID=4212 RepID=A0AAD5GGR8_AMBAR|nr:hypothetical protein M8C21_029291 [Ambrosia artemisiifolia]